MNAKKAQIGDTMTLIVSLTLVIIIMAVFYMAVALLFPDKPSVEESEKVFFSSGDVKEILAYIENNKESIDEWADISSPNGVGIEYPAFCNLIKDYANAHTEIYEICIETNKNKKIFYSLNYKEDCAVPIGYSPCLSPEKKQQYKLNREGFVFYTISNGGNLIEISISRNVK